MELIEDIVMIAADTARSRAYAQVLVQRNFMIPAVLILPNKKKILLPGQQFPTVHDKGRILELDDLHFDPNEPLLDTLKKGNISFEILDSDDIHDSCGITWLSGRQESIVLFSSFGGVILRHSVLSIGKRFLHIHGGYLPNYKGSTTNYYSVLEENICGASAIFLSPDIDEGPILMRRKFPRPPDMRLLDYGYDSLMRASVLLEVFTKYLKKGVWEFEPVDTNNGEKYYVIHPLLRHIAILGKGGKSET